ncbi:MAG: hypothetical protein WBA12_15710, partial [Catalinimonas sp.]
RWGVIDRRERARVPFAYDEILPWRADTVWVRDQSRWQQFDLKTGEVADTVVYEGLRPWPGEGDAVVRVARAGRYGVYSRNRGLVVPVAYEDVIDLGLPGRPLYFAARQHAPGQYEVIYYDGRGQQVSRSVVDEATYDALVCE